MAFINQFLLGWMLSLISAYGDQSISFSPISKLFPNSYWHSNITILRGKSLIEEGILVKVQLNQFQGLLFYAIDSKYRTIWVEFVQEMLEISYYNFIISEADKRSFRIIDLCIHINDNKLTLYFVSRNNEIIVSCNGNSQTMDYIQPLDIISENELRTFNDYMNFPVPYFNDTEGYLWIGNIPSKSDDNLYQNNVHWKSNRLNLWGCVELFQIKGTILKLATSGDIFGEMITPFCKPVCNPKSCFNDGKCFELWRGRFSCDCGFSEFVGDQCNLDYSVKFNGSFSFQHSIYFKLQKLQFAFQPVIDNLNRGHKLLSLKLFKEQYIHIYIDTNYFFRVRYVQNIDRTFDEIFRLKLINNRMYLVFIDANIDEIRIQISDSLDKSLFERKIIRHQESNIVITEILVGDSHSHGMDWMSKYQGCLTNLMLKVDSRKFIWNEIPNFDKFPSCKEVAKNTLKPNQSNSSKSQSQNQNTRAVLPKKNLNGTENNQRNNNYLIYITIASIFFALFIATLLIVIIIKFKLTNQKSFSESSDKIRLTDNFNRSLNQSELPEQQIFTKSLYNSPINSNNIYPSPLYMTFKPAYKAKSMTSSLTNRSIMSLPNPTSPTLATQEDGEL